MRRSGIFYGLSAVCQIVFKSITQNNSQVNKNLKINRQINANKKPRKVFQTPCTFYIFSFLFYSLSAMKLILRVQYIITTNKRAVTYKQYLDLLFLFLTKNCTFFQGVVNLSYFLHSFGFRAISFRGFRFCPPIGLSMGLINQTQKAEPKNQTQKTATPSFLLLNSTLPFVFTLKPQLSLRFYCVKVWFLRMLRFLRLLCKKTNAVS